MARLNLREWYGPDILVTEEGEPLLTEDYQYLTVETGTGVTTTYATWVDPES